MKYVSIKAKYRFRKIMKKLYKLFWYRHGNQKRSRWLIRPSAPPQCAIHRALTALLLLAVVLFLRKQVLHVLDGHVVQELTGALLSGHIHGVLRLEEKLAADDVLRGREVLLTERTLGLETNLERTETVELHAT